MARGKVDICGVDTSKLPVIKSDRVTELLTKAQSGDMNARNEFIQGNLRLVLSVLRRFGSRGENMDDLFQVGCIGLMKSISNFDLTLGVKFSTYAVPMIIGEVRRYLRDNNPIRVSRSLRDMAYRALKARDEITYQKSVEPTVGDIAKAISEREEDVVMALEAIQEPVSLYDPIYQDASDAIYVLDQVRDTRVSENDWVRTLSINQALSRLGEREKRIITRRYFSGRTQMEVASEIGISQAQVSRLEKSALQQMKRYIK